MLVHFVMRMLVHFVTHHSERVRQPLPSVLLGVVQPLPPALHPLVVRRLEPGRRLYLVLVHPGAALPVGRLVERGQLVLAELGHLGEYHVRHVSVR